MNFTTSKCYIQISLKKLVWRMKTVESIYFLLGNNQKMYLKVKSTKNLYLKFHYKNYIKKREYFLSSRQPLPTISWTCSWNEKENVNTRIAEHVFKIHARIENRLLTIEPKIDIDTLWFYLQLIVHFVLDKKWRQLRYTNLHTLIYSFYII